MILDKKISWFSSTRTNEVESNDITIAQVLLRIKNGTYSELINKVRNGDAASKKDLPTAAVHGLFENYRKREQFYEATGIIIIDIDDVNKDEIKEIKEDIIESFDSVLAVFISPSGTGIKVLYYVEPTLINAGNYRDIGKVVSSNFDVYGKVDFLSITDTLILTYDPDIIINPDAYPDYVYLKPRSKEVVELEPLDESMELWDDPEDFFDTVLNNDIASKTSNNFHFIQVAVLDMAKFGFYHPKEDLSFIVNYAEQCFKPSKDNEKRFEDIAKIANDYPQLKYPYKLTSTKQEVPKVDYKKVEKIEELEETIDGLVNYDTLFDSLCIVAKEGDRVGREISLQNFADIFRFKPRGILTVTGIPGHGKTEFVDQVILDLARLYGTSTLVVGFEQTPEEHLIKLIRKFTGVNVTHKSWINNDKNMPVLLDAYKKITSRIKHIDTIKKGSNITEILQLMVNKIHQMRENGDIVEQVVIDPFNMLSISSKSSGHEKIEEILRQITLFSHKMEVLVILVAHPFKMKKDEKTKIYEVPDFYSVKGSSAFFEMSYHGLVVYRTGYSTNMFVQVLKVKQNNLGIVGQKAYFDYHRESGRYIPLSEDGNIMAGDYNEKWGWKNN